MKSIIIKLKSSAGVYLLKNKGRIIYIGRSKNVLFRSASHVNDKRFDEIEIIWCENYQAERLEAFLINKHQPKHNCNLLIEQSDAAIKIRASLRALKIGKSFTVSNVKERQSACRIAKSLKDAGVITFDVVTRAEADGGFKIAAI